MGKQIFKSSLVVAAMTLISRILGFVRDMLIARLFGVDLATDAFFVAFKIPNFLRRLFVEGAFAHAFVPVLSDYKENASHGALKQFIDKTAGTFMGILMAITLFAMVTASVLVLVVAPGFAWSGEQHDLAVILLQISLPYLFFIGFVAFSGSVLNANERFSIPALTPVLLNITMIATAIWLAPMLDQPVKALAWGVFAGGLLQCLFQIPALMRIGLLL